MNRCLKILDSSSPLILKCSHSNWLHHTRVWITRHKMSCNLFKTATYWYAAIYSSAGCWPHGDRGADQACWVETMSTNTNYSLTPSSSGVKALLIPQELVLMVGFRQNPRTCPFPSRSSPSAGKCWGSCFSPGHLSLWIPGAEHIRGVLCDSSRFYTAT